MCGQSIHFSVSRRVNRRLPNRVLVGMFCAYASKGLETFPTLDPDAVVKLPAWKIGDRGFEPRSGIQVSKKQNVSSLLTRKDSILWGAPVTEK